MTAWKDVERRVAVALGGTRSGPVGRQGSDVTGTPYSVQVKRTASTTGGIRGDWIRQARRDGKAEQRPWILVVAGHHDRAPVAVVDFAWLVSVLEAAKGAA